MSSTFKTWVKENTPQDRSSEDDHEEEGGEPLDNDSQSGSAFDDSEEDAGFSPGKQVSHRPSQPLSRSSSGLSQHGASQSKAKPSKGKSSAEKERVDKGSDARSPLLMSDEEQVSPVNDVNRSVDSPEPSNLSTRSGDTISSTVHSRKKRKKKSSSKVREPPLKLKPLQCKSLFFAYENYIASFCLPTYFIAYRM